MSWVEIRPEAKALFDALEAWVGSPSSVNTEAVVDAVCELVDAAVDTHRTEDPHRYADGSTY